MIVFAVNVHTGGGAVLLEELLTNETFGSPITHLFIDKRYRDENSVLEKKKQIVIKHVKPELLPRLFAEIKLYHLILKSKAEIDTILFFGNLPPVFKFYFNILFLTLYRQRKAPQFHLFMQNALLFNKIDFDTRNIPYKLRFKLFIERWWLHIFYKNVDQIIIQNEWMKKHCLIDFPSRPSEIRPIPPFMPLSSDEIKALREHSENVYKFIHVGSILKHKNLPLFIKALQNLDLTLNNKIKVAIVLDTNRDCIPDFIINTLKFKKIEIDLYCKIPRKEVYMLYSKSEYLVCTSSFESFYIPMYEANNFRCKVLAPIWAGYAENLDFIHEYFDTEIPDLRKFIYT